MAGLPGTSCNSVCTLGKRQNLANLRSLISKYCTFCFLKAPLFLIFSKFACMVLVSGSRSSGIYSYTSLTRSFFSTSLTQSSLSEPNTADSFSALLIMKIYCYSNRIKLFVLYLLDCRICLLVSQFSLVSPSNYSCISQ